MRNRPPCKGEVAVTLHHGDIVNFVDVLANVCENLPNRHHEFTVDQGIDFIFEQLTQNSKIRIRYYSKNADSPLVLSSLRLNVRELPRLNNHNDDDANDILSTWARHVKPGSFFFVIWGNGGGCQCRR